MPDVPDSLRVPRLSLCVCRVTGKLATNLVGGDCPEHGGDACLVQHDFIDVDRYPLVPATELERLREAGGEWLAAYERMNEDDATVADEDRRNEAEIKLDAALREALGDA